MFEKSIFYLSSNRTGVMDTYKKGNYLFGTDGAETISFLYNHQDDFMTLEYMEYFNKIKKNAPIKENRKFIEHVRFWMEFITDETIFISSIDKTNQYILAYGDSKIRPINTGSGYSFLLPIVIACLGTVLLGEDTPTIIIENPEIFLHPEAQKKLMKFLIFCKKFVQIIIETHSEHIIQNTIENSKSDTQILVAEKKNNFTNILTFNGKDFKTNSYLEVIYRAFGVIVPEFHILLYGLVQQQYNVSSNIFESRIKDFDDYLKGLNGICLKKWKHENKDKNGYVTSITTYETLPTFIRNKIDHPEAKNPDTNKIYNYTYSEIEKSIEFLLNII
jgi:hypothetical protein